MTTHDYRTLELERDSDDPRILRVWLNRPERRNAINQVLLREVGDLFASLETDFETKVVVLGGRGHSFCAGADRKPAQPGQENVTPTTDREQRWISQLGRRACQAIEACDAVTIARVHGHAIGGGCCFAVSCDFRVMASDAILRVPEVDLGLPLTWGATPRLLHEIGAARTREVVMLCEDIDAERAERFGLIHRVAEPEALDSAVEALAASLAAKPDMALYMTKTQLRSLAGKATLGDTTETDADMFSVAARSDSAKGLFRMERKKS